MEKISVLIPTKNRVGSLKEILDYLENIPMIKKSRGGYSFRS